ncbi:MAG: holo-ACP synthase [Propionibacterium sp.]|nr:MAG: holo-ACP synthase [Propionibacterium sp.]
MITGIGVDVCDIARFAEMNNRTPGAVERVLTQSERELRLESQAARFAAKEALVKALGGNVGWSMREAEVVTDGLGRPSWRFAPGLEGVLTKRGISNVQLSLSHDAGVAVAFVVCEVNP